LELQFQFRPGELEQPQQHQQQQTSVGGAFPKTMASLFTFKALYGAYLDCRRKKRCKRLAQEFEVNLEENLFDLVEELSTKRYQPSPSFCFVAKNDKFREVFAAPFRDRVVHHLLVRYLEKIWEPIFIHDSFACRQGKGTHAGVSRLHSLACKVSRNSSRRAWFGQFDIKAFFPSIDRSLLLDMVLSKLPNNEMRWLAEVVILHDPAENSIFKCSPAKWDNIPEHKSLFSVEKGKGLPIGNLTSQFFANVYLNALDQFVKHRLKARFYLRYVDDFILLHQSKEQLVIWKEEIREFLHDVLKLELHPQRQFIRPLSNGIDALGYIVRPSYILVRHRVVENCKKAVINHSKAIVRRGKNGVDLMLRPEIYDRFQATINSYLGHFSHADSYGLRQSFFQKFKILAELFIDRGSSVSQRWERRTTPRYLGHQYYFYRLRFGGLILFQVGKFLELFNQDALWAGDYLGLTRIKTRSGFFARCGFPLNKMDFFIKKLPSLNFMVVAQEPIRQGVLVKRSVRQIHIA
jgi:RNA-directed DNA polymerase